MAETSAIAALSDNYIWTLQAPAAPAGSAVAIIDPGAAKPVLRWLERRQAHIGAILVTHHHADHTDGIDALLAHARTADDSPIPVYGPAAERDRVPQITHPLTDGDTFALDWLDLRFAVIATPGHTLGHIALHAPGMLFAGDTLFRGGCGRVFEGTPAQMQQSLARLRELPAATRVYSGHEYTQKNLAFAQTVEPDNPAITAAIAQVAALRQNGQPSLPGTLEQEYRINPFLRWDHTDVAQAASHHAGHTLTDPAAIFAELRAWKDAA